MGFCVCGEGEGVGVDASGSEEMGSSSGVGASSSLEDESSGVGSVESSLDWGGVSASGEAGLPAGSELGFTTATSLEEAERSTQKPKVVEAWGARV
jgi:hypothetical protein